MLSTISVCKMTGPPRRLPQSRAFVQVFLHRLYSQNRGNFYQTLGVPPSANQTQIKEKFYELSKKYHPDVNKDNPDALYKFKVVSEAYEVLSNPESKRQYDQQNGFNVIRKSSPFTNGNVKNFRRAHGMKGSFKDGRYVDDEAPPEMRNIEYDLSPEKMEKIWNRYKERWNRSGELERLKELERKKEDFRRRVDERRANMQNMTQSEKEDFLFQLRMMKTDDNVFGGGGPSREGGSSGGRKTVGGHRKDSVRQRSPPGSRAQDAPESSRDGRTSRESFSRESVRKDEDLDKWKEEIRKSMRGKLGEEEKLKNKKEQIRQFERRKLEELRDNDFFDQHLKSDSGNFNDGRKKSFDDYIYQGHDRDDTRPGVLKDEMFDDLYQLRNRVKDNRNVSDYLAEGYERSKQTVDSMKSAQPFSFNPQSVKHGLLQSEEVKMNRTVIIGVTVLLVICAYLNFTEESYDRVPVNKKCDR